LEAVMSCINFIRIQKHSIAVLVDKLYEIKLQPLGWSFFMLLYNNCHASESNNGMGCTYQNRL